MVFETAFATSAGPRTINEDSVGVWRLTDRLAVAVADGLGGMGAGDEASQLALRLFGEAAAQIETEDDLRECGRQIHSAIRLAQSSRPQNSNMATTLSAAIFAKSEMLGLHVGDSRISIIRPPGAIRLTEDHSEANRFLKAGKISKEEFRNYPRKNILDSALGARSYPQIDVVKFLCNSGDRFLFTTDGVHNKVFLREFLSLAESSNDAWDLIHKIENLVEARKPDDNYSLIAVFAS